MNHQRQNQPKTNLSSLPIEVVARRFLLLDMELTESGVRNNEVLRRLSKEDHIKDIRIVFEEYTRIRNNIPSNPEIKQLLEELRKRDPTIAVTHQKRLELIRELGLSFPHLSFHPLVGSTPSMEIILAAASDPLPELMDVGLADLKPEQIARRYHMAYLRGVRKALASDEELNGFMEKDELIAEDRERITTIYSRIMNQQKKTPEIEALIKEVDSHTDQQKLRYDYAAKLVKELRLKRTNLDYHIISSSKPDEKIIIDELRRISGENTI
jgi:hypothetical protein